MKRRRSSSPDRLSSKSPSPERLFSASPATRKRLRLPSPARSPRSSSPSPSPPNSPYHSCNSSPSDSPNHWQKDLLSTTSDSASVTPSSLSASFLADTLSGKFLFLFFNHAVGPASASLYAINLWNPSAFSSEMTSDHVQPTHIEPVIEFDYTKFPDNMLCVELNSKLYFLGGSCSIRPSPSLVDFYVLDISYAINCCNTSDTSSSSSRQWNSYEMLKKGPPMRSEKPNAYAFVAFGKIYVISRITGFTNLWDQFEVFDPDLDKWTVLNDPRLEDVVTSHSVIGDRVYISTITGLMYSYDPHKDKWRSCWEYHGFYGKADNIDTTLFGWNYYTGVTAYGLLTAEGVSSTTNAWADSGVSYLNRTKDMLPLLLMIGKTENSYNCIPPCLVHLGNRVFCCVVLQNSPDLDSANENCYKVAIRVTHFELARDPYRCTLKETNDLDREFLFDFKFINSAYFVGKSRYGSYEHVLQNCFHVPIH